jgi:hypothetical protein
MGDPSVAGKFCVLAPVRRGVSDLFSLQDSTLFSSFTTQMSIVCSPFGQLLTPECGSHAVLPRVEPSLFPETQAWTITRVCHIALGLAYLFLRFLNALPRPYTFLELADGLLGLVGNHDNQRA